MKLQKILTAVIVALGALNLSAQDVFISSRGDVTNEHITEGMSFNYNGSKVSIAGTEYETSAIDSITLDAPATMKFRGGDVSLLTRYEENGANYMDVNGTKITNMLSFFKQQGWNALRVRLFVDPSLASSSDKGQGVCQDLSYVVALGQRIKRAGFQFLLDFHYSDSWADPAKQFTPSAWSSLTANELYTKIYDYTKEALQQLVAADATPDFIQTGNEISYGMLWGSSSSTASSLKKCYTSSTDNWTYFTTLLKQAGKACREVCPKAKIIIHTERAGQSSVLNAFYERMKSYEVDYDIIGLSYYPYYHGTLTTLKNNLQSLSSTFSDKKIMIVETGYYHAWQPSDVSYDLSSTYPITAEGQKQFTDALIETLNSVNNVNGLFWWWPEANEYGLNWSTKRVTDNWYNAGLWDNQTGKALPALYELKRFK
jgi:arabinogalactan endo-1,4-beta-galactosidase